jgi:hypothetical protein
MIVTIDHNLRYLSQHTGHDPAKQGSGARSARHPADAFVKEDGKVVRRAKF